MNITKSVKVLVGVPGYQNVDYYVSISDECAEKDLEKVGEKLKDYCKQEVLKDINTTFRFWAKFLTEEEKKRLLETEI